MARKTALAAIFSLCLLNIFPKIISAEPVMEEKIASYEISKENFPWYLRAILFLSGYNLSEATIKTGILKSSDTAKIISLNIIPILYLSESSGTIKGIYNFREPKELSGEAAKELLLAWNFMHGNREGDYELKLINPIAGENGFIHSKFRKTKTGGQYLICGQTFNKKGGSNSDIEMVINSGAEPVIEKITITIKGSKKIILEKIKNPE